MTKGGSEAKNEQNIYTPYVQKYKESKFLIKSEYSKFDRIYKKSISIYDIKEVNYKATHNNNVSNDTNLVL